MVVTGTLSKKQLLAIDFFANNLLTKQLKKHIILNVRFVKNLPVCGYTEIDDYNTRGMPREFTFEIRRHMSEKQTLQTLAHEMEHLRQYSYGEIDEQGTMWLSRKFDHDSVPYSQRPWEIKAYEVEKILYREFTKKWKT